MSIFVDVDVTNGLNVRADNGSINFTDASAGSIVFNTGGDITGNTITSTGTNVSLTAGGSVTTDDISSNDNLQINGSIVDVGNLTNTGTAFRIITINADDITTGNLDSTGIVTLTAADGSVSTGTVDSAGSTTLRATNGNVTASDINAVSALVTADGNIAVGTVVGAGGGSSDINMNAGGALDFTSVSANRLVNLDGTVITGGGRHIEHVIHRYRRYRCDSHRSGCSGDHLDRCYCW